MNISAVNAFKSQNFTSVLPQQGRVMSSQGGDYVFPVDLPEEDTTITETETETTTKPTKRGNKQGVCEKCGERIHWQNFGDGVLVPVIIKD